ncbi:hypothetical protein Naga_103244g1, partial [Nannochloropsis gaditana]
MGGDKGRFGKRIGGCVCTHAIFSDFPPPALSSETLMSTLVVPTFFLPSLSPSLPSSFSPSVAQGLRSARPLPAGSKSTRNSWLPLRGGRGGEGGGRAGGRGGRKPSSSQKRHPKASLSRGMPGRTTLTGMTARSATGYPPP